ncbi:MAG: hypothetical protein M5U14_06020 [Acidimicrobiia bacterium]|nr:hypothetical protein [Acidimicrobiia bacterium]
MIPAPAAAGPAAADDAAPVWAFSTPVAVTSLSTTMRAYPAAAPTADGESHVLYGGWNLEDTGGDAHADTWTWRDGTWTPRCGTAEPGATGACGPGPRTNHGLAPGPTGVVLFGGATQQPGAGVAPVLKTDTWRWTGSSWMKVCDDLGGASPCGPAAGFGAALAGDGTRVVAFGGFTMGPGPTLVDDTWVFDGGNWTQVCGTGAGSPCGPSPRFGAALGWDGMRFVLFGGLDDLGPGNPVPLGDTWTFDGATWTQVCANGACTPPARANAPTATLARPDDPTLGGAVMLGGTIISDDLTLWRDAWRFRDGAWTQLPVPWDASPATFSGGPPPGLEGPVFPALAGRSGRCQVVLTALSFTDGGVSTRSGGWDVDGDGVPGGCDEQPPVPPRPSGRGYRLVGPDGGVFDFGEASFTGSLAGTRLNGPVVAAAGSPTGRGYWLAGADGGVFAFGDAGFHGSAAALPLRGPVVAMTPAPWGDGYWLLGGDGGVFAFGDAGFHGSAAVLPLRGPVVAIAATPTGHGYWLVGADGGVFAFGDAGFFGSAAHLDLNAPIVGLAPTPTGHGYWLVGADGAVLAFGDAGFHGSAAVLPLRGPVVAIAATRTGHGYWLVGGDGAVFAFGDATYLGANGDQASTGPVVGIAPA